jgi:endo-1,4-beta-xylanase
VQFWLVILALVGCATSPDDRPLRELAGQRDRHVGTFLFSAAGPDGPDQQAFQSALHELDMYILPVFFRLVQPTRGEYDFALPDAVADAAPANTVLYIPGLISNDLVPEWLSGNVSGDELRAILVDFVTTVVEHYRTKYPGRIVALEIVLEPLSWPGPPGPTGIWQRIGLEANLDRFEYVRLAYRTARAIAPDVKLYIDDFGVEGTDDRAARYYDLVSSLLADGVPLDGVGFEGHFMLGDGGSFPAAPPTETIATNLDRFGALGLDTMITSVDVSLRDRDASAVAMNQQAAMYRQLAHACLAAASCKAFATWGLGDADSWIPQAFPGWGSPLMFDAHYARKPSYDAVWTELAQ